LTQQLAQQIDMELMNPEIGGFTVEQLMELGMCTFLQPILFANTPDTYRY
jgi:hypothetical protein